MTVDAAPVVAAHLENPVQLQAAGAGLRPEIGTLLCQPSGRHGQIDLQAVVADVLDFKEHLSGDTRRGGGLGG